MSTTPSITLSCTVAKWNQTDKNKLAALSEEALYQLVRKTQQDRAEHMISITEMFPFRKVCIVYIPSSLKCIECNGEFDEETTICRLGAIRQSVGESALRIINNEVFITRQEFYKCIEFTLELLGLDYIKAIII
jgi:hypothetical protein